MNKELLINKLAIIYKLFTKLHYLKKNNIKKADSIMNIWKN